MEFIIGALVASLLISLAALVAQRRAHQRELVLALAAETRALDRAHATEIRSAQQLDALLDRISTAPRIEVRPAHQVTTDPTAKHYITDEPYMDEAWNDYRVPTPEPDE